MYYDTTYISNTVCGFHVSTNQFEILRETYGLIIFVFLFLRIGGPEQFFTQYPWNPLESLQLYFCETSRNSCRISATNSF